MSGIFPIGHYLGERQPDGRHLVRVGWEHRELTADEFGVWVLTHGPAENGRGAWTGDQVVALATQARIGDAAEVLARLRTTGAVADAADRAVFAGRHRLHPLMVGLGNSDAAPDRYRLGFPGLPPVAEVDTSAHELWQWAQLTPSLRHACDVREKVAAGLGEPVAPEAVLESLLADVRELLTTGCAFLDLAQPRA
jgi:hypothetical protein